MWLKDFAKADPVGSDNLVSLYKTCLGEVSLFFVESFLSFISLWPSLILVLQE